MTIADARAVGPRGTVRSAPPSTWLVLLLLTVGATPALPAQDIARVVEGRRLYLAADYTAALTALGDEATPDALQYRALCLLALGETVEARLTVEKLVTTWPRFVPADEEMPPRFTMLVRDAKQRLLPAALTERLARGRAHLDKAAYAEARADFEFVLSVTADGELRDVDGVRGTSDLASGFIDLLDRLEAVARSAAAATGSGTSGAPRAVTTPPVALRQDLPPPPAGAAFTAEGSATAGMIAAIRLRIGADGRVKAATFERRIHPEYDLRLLDAVYRWRYRPATSNGVAVESESLVSIKLGP